MKTAGVVFDFYDDLSGTHFKKAFPTATDLPDTIKTAHILTPEEREALRDDAYALVMYVNGVPLRKFACVDEGNTALSVLYFLENFDKLPESAIKTAAENLSSFCEEFDLPIPPTVKLAAKSGMARTRDPIRQPMVGNEADWAQRTNLVSIQGGADGGRVIPTASQMKTAAAKSKNGTEAHWSKEKKSGLGGGMVLTNDTKNIGVHSEVPHLTVNNDINLDSFHKLNPGSKPKGKKKLAGPIDVSSSEPAFTIKRASANLTALGGKFPLDAMADVQKAVEYFEESYKGMEPIEAHIFAVKTAARANELGIEISDVMQRYGSTEYADDVDAHLANRIACTADECAPIYKELREKRASIEPETFAHLLAAADEASGAKWYYGGDIADPYYATFGKVATAWSWQSRTGDFVSEDDLLWLARNGRPLIHKHFSSDLVNGFIKDPVHVFDSLPDDSKVILARLAADKFDGLKAN